jgi:broad specificity phosphatase PhoE
MAFVFSDNHRQSVGSIGWSGLPARPASPLKMNSRIRERKDRALRTNAPTGIAYQHHRWVDQPAANRMTSLRSSPGSEDDATIEDEYNTVLPTSHFAEGMNRRSAIAVASSVTTCHCINYVCSGRGTVLANARAAATSATSDDCGGCDCLSDLPPLSTTGVRLYLCRHGETDLNRLGRIQARRSDPRLNELGRNQASRLGRALSLSSVRPSVIYHSPLQRARETAEFASAAAASAYGTSSELISASMGRANPPQNPSTRELPELTEVDFGSVAEGRAVSAWRPGMVATYAAWAVGDWDARMLDDGESGREVTPTVH